MIAGGRRSCGKTTELIKLASVKHLYIVCASRQRVEHVAQLAKELELDIPYPVSISELPLKSRHIHEVLVDDIEIVLSVLLGKRVHDMTTSLKMMNM